MNNCRETLLKFLNAPLDCGDEIFSRFAALPGAIVGNGDNSLERFVYIRGNRPDRVVLVAHMDTVWDKEYGRCFSEDRGVVLEDGIFKSTNPKCGIGADDRAGCAMLWELRDSGHSILVVDGEEKGKHGARYLRKNYRKLFRELNRHCYMIEFDWAGIDSCLFNQVDNTKAFKRYIKETLDVTEGNSKGGTDLQVLCRKICGVNLSVGYHAHHSVKEYLVLSEWESMLAKVSEFLEQPQRRFHSKFFAPYLLFAKRCAGKVLRIIKRALKKETEN